MTKQELCAAARAMLERSYAPYSHFPVGAALECADGSVFTGCNIENAAFSPSEAEIRYAEEVMEAIEEAKRQGKGAISLRGKMIDAPIVERARRVLAMARQIEGGDLA